MEMVRFCNSPICGRSSEKCLETAYARWFQPHLTYGSKLGSFPQNIGKAMTKTIQKRHLSIGTLPQTQGDKHTSSFFNNHG